MDASVAPLTDVPSRPVDSGRVGTVPDLFHASSPQEAPLITRLNKLFDDALSEGVSDIHLEDPADGTAVVRFRLDGELRIVERVPRSVFKVWEHTIRLRARVPPSERKAPLDGRFHLILDGRTLDLRLSIQPLRNDGESLVCRLLDQRNAGRPLTEIDMSSPVRAALADILRQPNGLLLVTGPTGSGKTTTLYGILNALNSSERKIMTIEDPVEYRLPGICQVDVSRQCSFPQGLRSILRQDPDIILVGEIRDSETAQTAAAAAVTGHLVLSTLHANDAPSTLTRLVGLGVDPYPLGISLRAVMAQRLIKRLCACRRLDPLTDDQHRYLDRLGVRRHPQHAGTPVGCDACGHAGYHGRVPVIEMIVADAAVRQAIQNGDQDAILVAARRQAHFETLAEAAARMAGEGVSSLAEIARVAALMDPQETPVA